MLKIILFDIMIFMKKILLKLLDLIYKKRCYFCGDSTRNLKMCEKCFHQIQYLNQSPQKIIDNCNVYSATLYKDNVQKMIRGLKYHNQYELAFYQAKLMFDYWKNIEKSNYSYVIIPVPMFDKKEKKRGYNHMTLVAQEFAKLAGENYTVSTDIIKRIKDTKPQYKLTLKQRQANLKNAFALTEKYKNFKNEKFLIIDDILTTGSTLHEMIKTLNTKSINNITCLTTSCGEFYNN